ncbi:LAFE_0G14884g1_1 [Lachancea fermentati]|uniref:LAFE_0G14884g1_1 n=1 Tax=Lachancea fermentati TaxID=4955 RepID=A0A1G4MII6_LACFM|nr:LAFE_0G14884g1_1 [Lachancea fermentati]
MNRKQTGLGVLAATYILVLISIYSLWKVRQNQYGLYYWCAILLSPVMFWLWSVISWCGAQVFSNAKRE